MRKVSVLLLEAFIHHFFSHVSVLLQSSFIVRFAAYAVAAAVPSVAYLKSSHTLNMSAQKQVNNSGDSTLPRGRSTFGV